MVDSMSHHLLDLRWETLEPIGNVRPHWQHHRNSSDRHVMECLVTLTTGLRQGSRGTCLGSRTVLLVDSLRQLPSQIFAGPAQLRNLGLRGSQLLPST
jgi:hypothetical protein